MSKQTNPLVPGGLTFVDRPLPARLRHPEGRRSLVRSVMLFNNIAARAVQLCNGAHHKYISRYARYMFTKVKVNLLKSLVLQTCFLCYAINVLGQEIDTTYLTTYYSQKVSHFRLLPNTPGEIIFLGNSITDIGEWTETWQNLRVKNRGISSDNTFGVLARLDEIVESKPSKIFILIGINDIARNTPDSVILSNYKKIIQRIESASPRTIIYVQSILPTNDAYTAFIRHQHKDEHIRFINKRLESMCKGSKLIYVDLYSRFIDAQGKLDKRYTNDGLHLTGEGFALWKTILLEKKHMK
ncbi:sialate O-acetylesterase [Segetibacter sp. 3557_3]|uniref:GDSL-type esterase/lipase family protein n=1 Tax=Segetibacter sp. 3557_3 TaxID=2547429 RepID=UPI0010589753|nr:GDSL-type esterase/lipase family protein [Segetibacter sp. 3557_3]TDH28537.1 sialate O-acetylesterase [Segetibacter sp. 3557_3]